MKIAIIDYGMGNLRSVEKALHYVGASGAFVTSDAAEIEAADKAVLPGDGAFDSTMDSLRESGIDQAAQAFAASGRPLLGICIGMQVMLTASEEGRDWCCRSLPSSRPSAKIHSGAKPPARASDRLEPASRREFKPPSARFSAHRSLTSTVCTPITALPIALNLSRARSSMVFATAPLSSAATSSPLNFTPKSREMLGFIFLETLSH